MATTATRPRPDVRPRASRTRRAGRERSLRAAAALLAVATCGTAAAQTWRFTPSIGVEETLTDNVNLAPREAARGDLVSQITPAVAVQERSARTRVDGTISLPILVYARTGSDNDRVAPQVALTGELKAIDRLLTVEGQATVFEQYLSPFGPQPTSIAYAPQNRYTSQSYRVSPVLRGTTGDVDWLLRDDNLWTLLSDAPIETANSYTNALFASARSRPRPFGWGVEFSRTDVRFQGQPGQVTQLARARGAWRPDPQLELSASGGYEDNRYPFSDYHGAIYGAGFAWRPTPRTVADGFWEHRFFGSSYSLDFTHHWALVAAELSASRNVTSYPQQVAQLPFNGNVPQLLSDLFAAQYPDPAQRAVVVNQFIAANNLPTTVGGPVALYLQQIYLQEQAIASVGILGARNSVVLSGFRTVTEPITAGGATIPVTGPESDNTQIGAAAVWSHELTPTSRLALAGNWARATANASGEGRTTQGGARLTLDRRLSALSTLYLTLRYQAARSNFVPDWQEKAVVVGFVHAFR